jgi:hypothetical protein
VPTVATATASVQLPSPPGQYRPGGTSTYPAAAPAQHIELATRPTPPASANPPSQETAPAGSSVPWAPPASTTPAAGTGSRTY